MKNKVYKIYWTEQAVKKLKSLHKEIQKNVVYKVVELETNPFRYVKKLRNTMFYSLRVGGYRVIMAIELSKRSIVILTIELRRRAYRKM